MTETCAAGARVFDIFRVWRLDSGDYAQCADVVMTAWEARCRQDPAAAGRRPVLMNSNLSSADEALTMGR